MRSQCPIDSLLPQLISLPGTLDLISLRLSVWIRIPSLCDNIITGIYILTRRNYTDDKLPLNGESIIS